MAIRSISQEVLGKRRERICMAAQTLAHKSSTLWPIAMVPQNLHSSMYFSIIVVLHSPTALSPLPMKPYGLCEKTERPGLLGRCGEYTKEFSSAQACSMPGTSTMLLNPQQEYLEIHPCFPFRLGFLRGWSSDSSSPYGRLIPSQSLRFDCLGTALFCVVEPIEPCLCRHRSLRCGYLRRLGHPDLRSRSCR